MSSTFTFSIKAFALSLVLLPSTVLAQKDSTVIPLWVKGAPRFENRRNEPEKGDIYISNIHNPSITVYLPTKAKANAVLL